MTDTDLRAAIDKAAGSLRAMADGFAKRDDHEHPASILIVNDLRRTADELEAALLDTAPPAPAPLDVERLRRIEVAAQAAADLPEDPDAMQRLRRALGWDDLAGEVDRAYAALAPSQPEPVTFDPNADHDDPYDGNVP
jgi:hypothetical protein